MSYILDALKKIEHEKNRKSRSDGRTDISGDLFLERSRPRSTSGVRRILLFVVIAALAASGGTWYLLRDSGARKSASYVPPPPPPAAVQVPQGVTSVAPVSAPALPPAATLPVSPTPPAAPVSKVIDSSQEHDAAPARTPRRAKKQEAVATPVKVQKQPLQTIPAPADIKLSGIAWQDERAGRRAVINGFLLKEGVVVSGAKITEILADRVRFTSPAGVFEVKLDAVMPGEARR